MTKKKFSLSLINSLSIIVFLIIIGLGVSLWAYFSTQNVINHNLQQYLKQTVNLTNIILNNEKKNLNEIAYKTSMILGTINNQNNNMINRLNDSFVSQELDILFLQNEDKITDLSITIFDTTSIIEKIKKNSLKEGDNFLLVKDNGKHYLLLLSLKKVINEKTGRVNGKLIVGKILNDNYSLLLKIKKNASLENIYIFSDDYLIATSSPNYSLSLSDFKNKKIIKKNDKVYFNEVMKIDENQSINIVYIVNNSSIALLKNDLIQAGVLLFVFVVIAFTLLYFFTNKYFIKPFSKLLKFANEAKQNKQVVYENSDIIEFDDFAVKLKLIIDELRELKEQYSSAIEGVQDGLWDVDLVSGEAYYSKRYLQMLGYDSLNEVLSIKDFWKKSIHKKDYRKTLKKLSLHLKGETSFYEDNYRFKCKDGRYKWLKIRGKIFFDLQNNPIKMTGFHTDIDEFVKLQEDNKKKEQMIYQQSKLASMGEMIGNIAHQWRQPLNIISTISSSQIVQIQLEIDKKEQTVSDFNKIIETVQYLSTIIDKFRNFFNPNKLIEQFNIEDVIKDNIEIFETSYKSHGIELKTDLKAVEIYGYKFELMQVLLNLINNAKDALQQNIKDDEKKFIFMKNYIENKNVIIKVYDNAGGIKNKLKEKIYEPYFTTKHKSQGTGLGLYMSSEIIKKHFKGQIYNKTIEYEYEDLKCQGEEFSIVIPISVV